MKRRLTYVFLMACACCWMSCGGGGGSGGGNGGGGTASGSSDPVVVLLNEVPDTVINGKTVWSESALEKYLPVMQAQLTNDFGPIWHIGARVQLAGSGDYVLRFKPGNGPDDGDHGLDDSGSPEATVYVDNCVGSGNDPLLVAQHEVLEMLADPQADNNNREIVDPVVCWTYCEGQSIQPGQLECPDGSVIVPDFAFPAYFNGGAGPYDFMHLMKGSHGSCP
jgi:hypothetical protein